MSLVFPSPSHIMEDTPSAASSRAPTTRAAELDPHILDGASENRDTDLAEMASYQQASRTSRGSNLGSGRATFPTSQSIESENELDLYGPLDIRGAVNCNSSINFDGDFVVHDRVDAYGAINMRGNVRCEGRIKAYGNIDVNGHLVAREKIKGCGKLRVVGTLEGKDLEIYGNLSVNGHLNCRRLVVYGSLTLIGPDSSYSVETSEEVAGAILMRDQEADWDW